MLKLCGKTPRKNPQEMMGLKLCGMVRICLGERAG